ncbi:hypothetical protein LXL04_036696 [Taraxacum kok-saghyz]
MIEVVAVANEIRTESEENEGHDSKLGSSKKKKKQKEQIKHMDSKFQTNPTFGPVKGTTQSYHMIWDKGAYIHHPIGAIHVSRIIFEGEPTNF